MKKYYLITLIIFFILGWGYLFLNNPSKSSGIQNVGIDDSSKARLNELSLEQKIGQIFIIGFNGTILTSESENLIRKLHPGGILLLEKNIAGPEQLKDLINSLQEVALEDTGLPLFIAIDQEGGLISRLKWAENTPQFKIETAEQAYKIGRQRGQDLRESGINLNLAPLLDYVSKNNFIYQRSFQNSKEKIGEFSQKLIFGQKETGILSAVKHFPGYGGISFNPEDKLAKIEKIPEISQFKKANEAEPEFIMISNVVYEEFGYKLPFSFLPEGIDFLKRQIEGNYIIISDDLSQYSLLNNFSLKDVVSSPFLAGIDVLIFSDWRQDPEKGVDAFSQAFSEGKIGADRLDQAVLKIIKLKQKL